MYKKVFALLSLLLLSSVDAHAYDWSSNVHVTLVDASAMPNALQFITDSTLGKCAAGTWITWQTLGTTTADKQENNKAVLSLLMTAVATGKSINLYGFNAGCTVQFVMITNSGTPVPPSTPVVPSNGFWATVGGVANCNDTCNYDGAIAEADSSGNVCKALMPNSSTLQPGTQAYSNSNYQSFCTGGSLGNISATLAQCYCVKK